MIKTNQKLLLDTHALVMWVNRDEEISHLLDFLDNSSAKGLVSISIVSFWEITLLYEKKRLEITNLAGWFESVEMYSGAKVIQFGRNELVRISKLPKVHKDPFDRMLIAQAQEGGMTFITRDSIVEKYDVKTRWSM